MPLFDVIKTPECPLCKKPMVKKANEFYRIHVFVCFHCEIMIREHDPCVNNWEMDDPKEPCPNPKCDGTIMRYFRTENYYIKLTCPKCKMSIEATDEDQAEDHMKQMVKRMRYLGETYDNAKKALDKAAAEKKAKKE